MVTQLRALADALDEIPGLTVIRTNWLAGKRNEWGLPAVIVDYAKPVFEEFAENGLDVQLGDKFYFELSVKRDWADGDPTTALAKWEEQWLLVQAKLEEHFGTDSISIVDGELIDATLGLAETLSFVCDLDFT